MSKTESKIIPEVRKYSENIISLARQLTPRNQAYVLDTINALLYAQQTPKEESKST